MIARKTEAKWIRAALKRSRVVALLGPRQSGKTTLARTFVADGSLNYFDLEDPTSLARLTAMESLCTSSPMHRTGRRPITGAAGLGRGGRVAFCGWTGFRLRSMYVFMVSVFLSSVVWGVSPTTCGSAPFTRCNPRLLRRADTLFAFIASHTV